MQRTSTPAAMTLALCVAIAPVGANAAQSIERDASPALLAMGPDPGGKTGAGVTPETTRTDHPAAGGPQSSSQSAEPKTGADDKREQSTVQRDDGRDRSNAERAPSGPSSRQ